MGRLIVLQIFTCTSQFFKLLGRYFAESFCKVDKWNVQQKAVFHCVKSVEVFANIIVFRIINVAWMHYHLVQQELLESNTLLCVDRNLFLKCFFMH